MRGSSIRLVPCCHGFIRVLQILTIATAHLKPGFSEHKAAALEKIRQPGHAALTVSDQAEATAGPVAGSKGGPASLLWPPPLGGSRSGRWGEKEQSWTRKTAVRMIFKAPHICTLPFDLQSIFSPVLGLKRKGGVSELA